MLEDTQLLEAWSDRVDEPWWEGGGEEDVVGRESGRVGLQASMGEMCPAIGGDLQYC